MTGESTAWESVIEPMRRPLHEYVALIEELAGANAKALTLFGAIVTNAFDAQRHTARSVLVVERVDLPMLRRLAEHGTKLGKAAIAAPLIMTPEYIKTSLDTFPLEFIEIKQRHLTVSGDDYFDELTFDDPHVRLQCERELKSVLIALRQGLLAAAGREKFIHALEMDVGERLMRILRGLLWLKGQTEAKPASHVLTEVEKIADRKLPGIKAATDPATHHGWDEFESLYRDVEELGEIANGW